MKLIFTILMLSLGMCSINIKAQTKKAVRNKATISTITKKRIVEDDGYIWYKLKKGNLFGAQDIEDRNIVPISYDNIEYICGHFYEGNAGHYFRVKKGDFVGIYTREGTCVIPIEKHYVKAWMEHDKYNNYIYWKIIRNGNKVGIADVRGRIILEPIYNNITMYFANDYSGKSKEMTPYFLLEFNGKQGICLLNGKIVCPPKKYKYCFLTNTEGKYTIDKYKNVIEIDDEERELIKYEDNTVYDYEPYEDLLYPYPMKQSSSASSFKSSSSSSSSNSSSNNSGNKTTKVIVEHHHDPVPMTEWVPCGACGHNPGVCQTCVGMGTSASGRQCISCRGSGKCHLCNGKGGRYQTVYR